MISYILIAVYVAIALCVCIATFAFVRSKKISYLSGQVQCGSGDAEVMVFNFHFLAGDSEESKKAKLAECWKLIQDRRDENHAKYLAIKAEAFAEKEAKIEDAATIKPVTQES